MRPPARVVKNLAWCLPRPRRRNPIPGCFPEHFEKKLLAELGWPQATFHPFGGAAEYGVRLDIRAEVRPDIIGDAHQLPLRDSVFDCTILDPPYDVHYSERLYRTGNIRWSRCVSEALRVTKVGGFIVVYHLVTKPVPPHCVLTHRILVETRLGHAARIVHVYRKSPGEYHQRGYSMGKTRCAYCGEVYKARSPTGGVVGSTHEAI